MPCRPNEGSVPADPSLFFLYRLDQVARVRDQGKLGEAKLVNENFSLIVMCLFLLASLAFLAEQLTSYH
jgi:hypothetical protein